MGLPARLARLFALEQVVHDLVGSGDMRSDYVLRFLLREARLQDAILLFDEADAFLSAHTSVESSTDRLAKSGVSELLGLIEHFEGLVTLTTNLDPALRWRVRYRLEFPRPVRELREWLWQRLLPENLPLGESADSSRSWRRLPT